MCLYNRTEWTGKDTEEQKRKRKEYQFMRLLGIMHVMDDSYEKGSSWDKGEKFKCQCVRKIFPGAANIPGDISNGQPLDTKIRNQSGETGKQKNQ